VYIVIQKNVAQESQYRTDVAWLNRGGRTAVRTWPRRPAGRSSARRQDEAAVNARWTENEGRRRGSVAMWWATGSQLERGRDQTTVSVVGVIERVTGSCAAGTVTDVKSERAMEKYIDEAPIVCKFEPSFNNHQQSYLFQTFPVTWTQISAAPYSQTTIPKRGKG